MPRYEVELEITSTKKVIVFAKDEAEATKKANDIVSKWDNIERFEIADVIEQ